MIDRSKWRPCTKPDWKPWNAAKRNVLLNFRSYYNCIRNDWYKGWETTVYFNRTIKLREKFNKICE